MDHRRLAAPFGPKITSDSPGITVRFTAQRHLAAERLGQVPQRDHRRAAEPP
jgi:hypothetical protein